MAAYKYSLPSGIPGMVTRSGATIEPQLLDSSNLPTAYGVPVVLDATSHKLRAVKSGDTVVEFGILVRPYPFQSTSTDFGPGGVPTSGLVDVMRRGYISVKLNGATASFNGGTVYVRVANGTANDPVGGILAAAAGTAGADTVAMTKAFFTGPADADGNAELEFHIS